MAFIGFNYDISYDRLVSSTGFSILVWVQYSSHVEFEYISNMKLTLGPIPWMTRSGGLTSCRLIFLSIEVIVNTGRARKSAGKCRVCLKNFLWKQRYFVLLFLFTRSNIWYKNVYMGIYHLHIFAPISHIQQNSLQGPRASSIYSKYHQQTYKKHSCHNKLLKCPQTETRCACQNLKRHQLTFFFKWYMATVNRHSIWMTYPHMNTWRTLSRLVLLIHPTRGIQNIK